MPASLTHVGSLALVVSLFSTACIKKTDGSVVTEGDSSAEFVAGRAGPRYRALIPLTSRDNAKKTCFFDLSWERMGGRTAKQKAGLATPRSVDISAFTSNPNGAAGLGTTGSIAVGILATGFCLAGTAGAGSVGCFVLGGAIVAGGGAGVGAAAMNHRRWEEAFRGNEVFPTSPAKMDQLRNTMTRVSNAMHNTGSTPCPGWEQWPTERRAQVWPEIVRLVEKKL